MSLAVKRSGRSFEIQSDPVDVTSISRADTAWVYTDAAGHEHRWFANGAPATAYDPRQAYEVPSLKWVVDDQWIDEYGDERESGHSECVTCGEHVTPRTKADDCTQCIPGLQRHYIDGVSVTRETFIREARAEGFDIPE